MRETDKAVSVYTHRHLLKTVEEHLVSERYQEAILIAQAGAEACAATAITMLLDQHPERLRAALLIPFWSGESNYNLIRPGPRKVWTFVTEEDITEHNKQRSFWQRYKKHTELRNDVAHNTAFDLTKQQAAASLEAAAEFVGCVEQVTERVLGPGVW